MSAPSGRKWRLFSIIWLVLFMLSGSITASSAKSMPAQTPEGPERFAGVTKWVGTFSIQVNKTIEDPSIGLFYWTLNRNVSGSLSATYDSGDASYHKWVGSYEGHGTIDDEEKQSTPNCIDVHTWDWSGAIGSGVRLFIDPRENDYLFYLDIPHNAETDYQGRHVWCEDGGDLGEPWNEKRPYPWHPSGSNIFTLPLPEEGLVLEGTREIEGQWPGTTAVGWSTWTVSWHLEPADEEELEVVVQPYGYDTWIPKGPSASGSGNVSQAPGTTTAGFAGLASPPAQEVEVTEADRILGVTANLQRVGGAPATQKAERFIFDLIEVSREPGIAMNAPLKANANRDPDLEFDPSMSIPSALVISDYLGGQRAEWLLPGSFAGVLIRSNDYGGWGILKVTAVLESGEEIVGYLQGDPSQTEILLPKRKPHSYIADAWKEQHGVAGLPDISDIEDKPVGDARVKGDGLTLYQEYRGFFEGGKHIRTNPQVKDLFINDRIGGRSKDGIALFTRITNLEVHHLLKREEMDLGKLINFNHSEAAPHIEHQNALVLQQAPAGGQQSHVQAELGGKPLVPGNVKELLILPPADMGPNGWKTVKIGGKPVKQDLYSATVAHELLHAINVEHHGEGDEEEVHWEWSKVGGKDVLTENGMPIKIKNERGNTVAWDKKDTPDGIDLWMGVPHGQHSGSESCVMRYDTASAYRAANTEQDSNLRYWVSGEEPVGDQLCGSPTGTGVNKDGRKPQSRYGDAAAGQGDCAHQFIVNDVVMWTGIK